VAWKFTVLDDPVVNAFAMPGGYIYITRGILAHLNSEAQLAGVLGHEIGHVTARHTAHRITQQQLAGVGLGLVSIAVEGFQRYGQAAQTALGLLFLKYSRDDETQADELGVQYTTAAGYDPREIPATYAMLERVAERAGSRLPAFFSTHPDPGSRHERTGALAAQAAAGKQGLVVRGRDCVKRQDGLVFGQDPRQGYLEGDRYYHPALGFEVSFPSGWKVQDTRRAVMAQAPDQGAKLQMTLVQAGTLSPGAYVAELERSARITGSSGATATIGGYPAWAGRLRVAGDRGQVVLLVAAYVRKSPGQMFEFLGSPGADGAGEGAILGAARSFRPLTDAARLAAEPDRVRVIASPKAGKFQDVVAGLGPQAVDVETEAILNNTYAEQPVQAGELVKIVVGGRRQ
jgi:predicted Zn-dependent protease